MSKKIDEEMTWERGGGRGEDEGGVNGKEEMIRKKGDGSERNSSREDNKEEKKD